MAFRVLREDDAAARELDIPRTHESRRRRGPRAGYSAETSRGARRGRGYFAGPAPPTPRESSSRRRRCSTRDRDGNTPLHFALVRAAHPDVVALLVRTRPEACATRGFLGRLPLSLAMLYEAHPDSVRVVRDAYPDAIRNEEIVADFRNHGKLADYARCEKCEPKPPEPSNFPEVRP